jgi:hypothetical protein
MLDGALYGCKNSQAEGEEMVRRQGVALNAFWETYGENSKMRLPGAELKHL